MIRRNFCLPLALILVLMFCFQVFAFAPSPNASLDPQNPLIKPDTQNPITKPDSLKPSQPETQNILSFAKITVSNNNADLVNGATVEVMVGDSSVVQSSTTNENGEVKFVISKPGIYTFKATFGELVVSSFPIKFSRDGQSINLPLKFPGLSELSGRADIRVINTYGGNITGATVQSLQNGIPVAGKNAVTDANGQCLISGLIPGQYTFQALGNNVAGTSDLIKISHNTSQSVFIKVSGTGTALVTVKDQYDQPLKNATIQTLQSGNLLEDKTGVTNDKGQCTISHLAPGLYSFKATYNDWTKLSGLIEIKEYGTSKVNLTIDTTTQIIIDLPLIFKDNPKLEEIKLLRVFLVNSKGKDIEITNKRTNYNSRTGEALYSNIKISSGYYRVEVRNYDTMGASNQFGPIPYFISYMNYGELRLDYPGTVSPAIVLYPN